MGFFISNAFAVSGSRSDDERVDRWILDGHSGRSCPELGSDDLDWSNPSAGTNRSVAVHITAAGLEDLFVSCERVKFLRIARSRPRVLLGWRPFMRPIHARDPWRGASLPRPARPTTARSSERRCWTACPSAPPFPPCASGAPRPAPPAVDGTQRRGCSRPPWPEFVRGAWWPTLTARTARPVAVRREDFDWSRPGRRQP